MAKSKTKVKAKDEAHNKRFSLKTKLLIPILVGVFLVVLVLSGFWYTTYRSNLVGTLGQQAADAASLTASSLDSMMVSMALEQGETGLSYSAVRNKLVTALRVSSAKYIYALTTDGVGVYYAIDGSDEPATMGATFPEDYEYLRPVFEGNVIYDDFITYEGNTALVTAYAPIGDTSGNIVAIVGCDYEVTDAVAKLDAGVRFAVIVLIAACAMMAVVVMGSIGNALQPMKSLRTLAERTAKGDLSEFDMGKVNNDELGDLVVLFRGVVDHFTVVIQDVTSRLRTYADCDFREVEFDPNLYCGDFAALGESLVSIRKSLQAALASIREATNQVGVGTEQIASGAGNLSEAVTEQAAAMDSLAVGVDGFAKEMRHTVAVASRATSVVECTVGKLEDSKHCTASFTEAIQDIRSKAEKINSVVNTINDIAFQTNILALNAAVEAARAGSAGKGFAVVADEVRNLAQKTADATQDTATLVEETVKSIQEGSALADQLLSMLQSVVADSESLKVEVTTIADVCTQKMGESQKLMDSIAEVNSVVQNTSALAEETAATCEELSSQVVAVVDQLNHFVLDDTVVSDGAAEDSRSAAY